MVIWAIIRLVSQTKRRKYIDTPEQLITYAIQKPFHGHPFSVYDGKWQAAAVVFAL